MTQQRILDLAYFKALDNWGRANEMVEALPQNRLAKEKEKMAHDELIEVSRLLWEEEHK